MTDPTWPNPECPVWIGALVPGDAQRVVLVMREDGSISDPEGCRDEHELRRLVEHARASADIHDPAQVYWADHPGQWPSS